MKISTLINYAGGFKEAVAEVKALEKAGLDVVWVPEAYSFDAPTAMGYLAAETERVIIASGILPIYTRTPSLLAMTAAGLDYLSDGRAMLGLGASGPQVIEGFHGLPYTAPVARTREVIDICRQVWRPGVDWQNAGSDDHSLGFSRKVTHGGGCVERVGLWYPDHIQTCFFECFYFSDGFFKATGIIDQGRNFQGALQLISC